MGLFNTVLNNKSSVYDMFFFSIKSVLEYQSIDELKENKPEMHLQWIELADKYLDKFPEGTKPQAIYEKYAPNYPEFSKILAITYGAVHNENGELKRILKRTAGNDEYITIMTFMDVLNEMSSDGMKSTPHHFPILCGYNIINHDIPLLIKRYFAHKEELGEKKQLPYMLKRCLDAKPWEDTVIDVSTLWKFNGFNGNDNTLMLIAELLSLKKTVSVWSQDVLSWQYWEKFRNDPKTALEFISLQSATQTNLIIQLMVELRQH